MSKQDISILYKLIEDILLGEDANLEDVYRSLLEINSMAVVVNGLCLSNIYDSIYHDICIENFKLLNEVVESVLRFLGARFTEEKIKPGDDALSRFYNVFLDSYNILKNIIHDSLIVYGEKVLCRVLKPISIYNVTVAKGYITPLHIGLASILGALGYVEPIYTAIQIKNRET